MLHTRIALSRPVTTVMAALAVMAVGIISTSLLRLEAMPDISFPGMQIVVPYAGSTPEEMEELVVRPIEEALATLSGIEEIRASAQSDQATFTVLFDWDRDADAAAFDVRTKLDSIRPQLPAGADRLLMFAFSSGDQPVAVIRIASDRDLTDQYEMLEKYLQRPMERIEGVARVELEGVQPREVRILVDPTRLATYNVDVRELRQALAKANFSVSAGEITENDSRFTVRPIGEFSHIDDVRNLLIGRNVRLSDIAQVEMVAPELTVGRRMDGKPAVGIDVFKATQANVVEVADRVIEAVENARALPQFQGIQILIVGNQADSIRSSLRELRNAGMIGAVLSFFMLLFFLRHLPTTVIVSLAVPASLLVTLAAMYFLGFTLNILTMMGMLLAIGMLVDNSVVITESIFRHRQLHPGKPLESTLAGVKEVGVATLAGTCSMVIVFLPLVFGERNQMSIFLVHVAVPIIVAMLASLVIAQTLLPMLAARMSPPPPVQEGSWFARLQDRYEGALDWALTHRKWMALITLLIVLSPVPLFAFKITKVDPFPQEASRTLMINYHIEGSYPMERVEQAVRRVEAYIAANQERFEVDTYYTYWVNDEASTRLYLTPKEDAKVAAAEIMERVLEGMPEIIIGKPNFTFDEGMGGSTSFSLQLAGESTERLATISRDVAHRLSSVEGLEAVRSEAGTGEQEVQVIVNRDRASQLGLTTQDIALTVAGAMRGDRLPELRTSERELTMRLAFRESDRQSVEDLARLPVMLPDGSRTDLGAVADFVVMPSDREIQRVNRLTTASDQREPDAGHDHGRGARARRADHGVLSPAGRLHVEVRPRLRRERQGHPDHDAEHAARGGADLPGDGVAVRVRAVPALDHHLDRVRDRGLDLVPDADRHHDHDDGHDRLHGADGGRGEHRHRAHRARDRPAPQRPAPPSGDPAGGPRPAAPDHDDDAHDAARHAAAGDRRCPGGRRRRRPGLPPARARDHGRSDVLGGGLADHRAGVLRVVR